MFFSCHQKKDSFYDNIINADGIDLIETVEDVYNHLEAVEKSAIMLMNTKGIKDSVLFYSGKLQGIQDAKKILLELKSVYQ